MTRISIELDDADAAELRRRAEQAGQSTDMFASQALTQMLKHASDERLVLSEVRRRQGDGLVGRPVDEVFDELDQKYGLSSVHA